MSKMSGNKIDRRRGATVTKEKGAGGREIWHVTADGEHRTITTSSASASVMDKAMLKYSVH